VSEYEGAVVSGLRSRGVVVRDEGANADATATREVTASCALARANERAL
jgi:hypothetical protein